MSGAAAGSSTALLKTPGLARVAQLVPDDQDLLAVPVGTRVEHALEMMRTHDYDQLPVVTSEQRVVGVFTYRSMAAGLPTLRNRNALSAVVEDLRLEDFHFVRASQELVDVVAFAEAGNAVLVGDEDHLLAIVTPADVCRFLWRRTRPFVLLQDIELAVRGLMRSACTSDVLAGLVADSLPPGADRADARLEDLTMGKVRVNR